MSKKLFTALIILSFSLFSCGECQMKQELESLQLQLENHENTIAELEASMQDGAAYENGDLVHIILLSIKEKVDHQSLIKEIEKLDGINQVKLLDVGMFENLGDSRALTYDLAMVMSFENAEAYSEYQNHQTHLNLKEVLGPFLSGPPASFDFITQ